MSHCQQTVSKRTMGIFLPFSASPLRCCPISFSVCEQRNKGQGRQRKGKERQKGQRQTGDKGDETATSYVILGAQCKNSTCCNGALHANILQVQCKWYHAILCRTPPLLRASHPQFLSKEPTDKDKKDLKDKGKSEVAGAWMEGQYSGISCCCAVMATHSKAPGTPVNFIRQILTNLTTVMPA
eukprot:360774-Chlamydomonas_euryale.AAC.6